MFFAYNSPRYQVSVYRTIGPLLLFFSFLRLVFALLLLNVSWYINYVDTIIEPRCEKTGLRGFRPGPTQTGLYSHRK